MAEPLLDWFTGRVPAGGRVLVAGSGAGRECFALAARGWQVTGVDFSEPMVEAAKQEALRRGLGVDFELADLRSYDRPGDTLAAVYFTYEVYSFLPAREERLALLAKMARWLAPGGVIFLSARWFEGFYAPAILTLQRAVRLSDRQARWGQSHTRWLALDGAVHRSFIHIFTKLAVEREARQAGLEPTGWLGSHCLLVPSLPDFPLGS